MENSSTVEEHLHDGIERSRSTIVREPSGRFLRRFSPYDDTELAEGALELAIVVPTFNEIENIDTLVFAIKAALEGHDYEIIVVDDNSPDGTADRVREIAKRNLRVRCIHQIGRRGLSGAFIEGALATAAPVVAVIDGDMQHDEMLLPAMLKTLRSRDLEVVVGARYLEQGGVGNSTEGRVRVSQWATAVARRVTGVTLSDPMSGFFMIRSDVVRRLAPNLSAIGFKILSIFSSLLLGHSVLQSCHTASARDPWARARWMRRSCLSSLNC